MKTSATRKLLTEAEIILINQRVELGVPLNKACKLLHPDISNVVIIRLVNWYAELENALANEDFRLHETIRNSMFPEWLPDNQPDNATYYDAFPYGKWVLTND